ncbi:MAG: hypothetical protein R3327_06075, partial [Nitrosopumilaceae archaeon]|nr:hypothetical protein [Nitrosopumilaceae archaeon]
SSMDVDIKEFDETLKTADLLVDESVQIYELENEKINVVDELYNSLKSVTEFLGFSVNVPSDIFKFSNDTKVTLTPSLDIIIIHPNGKEEQKRFDQLSIEQITQVLKYAVNPIIELTKKEKEIQNKNITFMRAVSEKFAKINNINTDISEETKPVEKSGGL